MNVADLLGALDEPIADFLETDFARGAVTGVTGRQPERLRLALFLSVCPGLRWMALAFVAQALEKGAVLALISGQSELPEGIDMSKKPILRVRDPHLALARFGWCFLSGVSGAGCCGYRNQWQDIHCLIHAADMGQCREKRSQYWYDWHRRAKGNPLWRPDDTRSGWAHAKRSNSGR